MPSLGKCYELDDLARRSQRQPFPFKSNESQKGSKLDPKIAETGMARTCLYIEHCKHCFHTVHTGHITHIAHITHTIRAA